MSGYNYSITYDGNCTTLFVRFKGKNIPLISSEDRLQVGGIYHNILAGVYKNVLDLCEEIHDNFNF